MNSLSLFAPLIRRSPPLIIVNNLTKHTPKRQFHLTYPAMSEKLKPAARVSGNRQDVW